MKREIFTCDTCKKDAPCFRMFFWTHTVQDASGSSRERVGSEQDLCLACLGREYQDMWNSNPRAMRRGR